MSYIDYKNGGTLLRVGRQLVNLDDQRFVGAVEWRQMPQTFFGYAMINNSIKDLSLMVAYVTDRYGITDAFLAKTETVLLHADYQATLDMKLTGYGYMIGSSSDTFGVMATGKSGSISYIAEVATQQDASFDVDGNNSKPKVDATYFRGDVSTNFNGFIVGAVYESLGEQKNGTNHGFTMPLSTLHKWQGFADVFLKYTGGGKNANGLNDAYAKIGYIHPTMGTLMGFYHNFTTKTTTGSFDDKAGNEMDLLYTYPISKTMGFLAKAALFTGESNSVVPVAQKDKTLYWVQLDYRF